MEKRYLFISIVIIAITANSFNVRGQGVAVNKTNTVAHSSAMLDISSDDSGLLIPRVSLTNLSSAGPIDSPAESLLVYNTNTGTGKGYYYWTGAEWMRLTITNDLEFVQGSGIATEIAFWTNTNTLGSSSNLFWDNTNKYLGIGTNNPTALLSVLGNHEEYIGVFWNQNTTAYDAKGIIGICNNSAENGIGVYGDGGWVGVMGGSMIDGSGDRMGVWGYANANADSKIGLRGSAEGSGINYGVYGIASGGSENWAGYFAGDTYIQTNLGLGVISPTAQLHTNGTVRFSNYMNGFLYVDNLGNLGVSTASSLFNAGTGLSWSGSTLNSVWTASGNNIYNNNSGNVGIGTATPTNAKLHVEGSGTYDAVFRLRNIEASGANVFFVASNSAWTFGANKLGIGLGDPSSTNVKMTVQENGNVGIGVTSPAYKLDVSGTGCFSDQVTIPETPTADAHAASKKYVDDQVGAVLPTNNVTGSGTATRVAFWNGTNSLSSSASLFWDNTNARLGIGIATPESKLEIRQNMSSYTTAFTGAHLNLGTSNTLDNTGFVGITYDASTSANYGWSSGALRSSGGQSDFVWKHHSSSAEGTERMRITSTGRLGIGTNAPSAQLHTTGTVRFQNYTNGFLSVDANGNLSVSAVSSIFTAGTGLSWSGTTLNSVWTVSGNNIYNNNTANVGVGTNSPQAKLHLITPNLSGNEVSMRIGPVGGGSSTTSSTSILDFYSTFDNYSADQGPRRTASIKVGFNGSTWGSEYMSFHVGNNGSANDDAVLPFERMRIAGNGNVGIGTSSPSSKLHINAGSARISGSTNTNAESGGMLIYDNTSGLGAGSAKKVERYSKLVMSSGSSYQIYDDFAVTLYAYRSGNYYYIRLAPKSGYTGWWDYSTESAGDDVNCSTAGTQYTMSSNWGVDYTGGLEVIINREDNSSAPTYRIRPHLHSSTSNGYSSIIVEVYYP